MDISPLQVERRPVALLHWTWEGRGIHGGASAMVLVFLTFGGPEAPLPKLQLIQDSAAPNRTSEAHPDPDQDLQDNGKTLQAP